MCILKTIFLHRKWLCKNRTAGAAIEQQTLDSLPTQLALPTTINRTPVGKHPNMIDLSVYKKWLEYKQLGNKTGFGCTLFGQCAFVDLTLEVP